MKRPSPLLGVLFVMCFACAVSVHADPPAQVPGDPDSTADVPSVGAPWSFEKGKSVALVLRDGSRVVGDVVDVAMMPASQYRTRYAAWQDSVAIGALLPRPGDNVQIVRRGKTYEWTFEGFAPGGLYLRHDGEPMQLLDYEHLTSIARSGAEPVATAELERLDHANALPSPRVIVVGAARDTTVVMVDDIERVEWGKPKSNTGKIIAGLLAVGILATIIYAMGHGCGSSSVNPGCDMSGVDTSGWFVLQPASIPPHAPPARG